MPGPRTGGPVGSPAGLRRALGPLPGLFVAALAACAEAGDREPAMATIWEVADSPSVTVGVDDEQPGHALVRVVGATRLSDGRLVVAEAGTSELRVFGPEGDYQGALAGEGDGPGELRFLAGVVRLPGDTLLTLARNPGLSWFHPDEGYVRQAAVDPTAFRIPCWLSEGGSTPLPNGDLVVVYEENPGMGGCPERGSGVTRSRGLVARFRRDAGILDTLVILPGTERNPPNYRVYGGMMAVAVGGGRVFAGDTRGDSIHVIELDGAPGRRLPTPFPARPVPPEARSQEVRRGTRPDGTEVVGNPYAYPETYPRYARLLADGGGDYVWVMGFPPIETPISSWVFANPSSFRLPADGGIWRGLHLEGEVVAELRVPRGVFPLEVGPDYLLGLRRNALDVLSVGVYELRR